MRGLVEQMLLEQPHVFLDMDNDSEESVWDFCAEDKPKTWVVQLINLYALKKLVTLNKRKNPEIVLYLTQDEVDDFTKNLLNDPFFIIQAKKCIESLKKDNKFSSLKMLQRYLPSELKDKLELSTEKSIDNAEN